MNASKKNISLTNGWILCPSKSFPGKFYYFNVLNGEAAWSLNEADKKGLRKDTSIHKITNKSHDYPEPTTSPDGTSIISCNIVQNCKRPDFLKNTPFTQHLPTFGQTTFPKYVANVEPLMSNIVWTPVQLPMPMFCPENKKPMSDKITQTTNIERELFIKTCDIPLCKRFKNYEQPSLSFDKKNKIVNKPLSKFETSTPKSSVFESKPLFQNQNTIPKSKLLIRKPVLNLEIPATNTPQILKTPTKPPDIVQSTTITQKFARNSTESTSILSNMVESTAFENVVPKLVRPNTKSTLTLRNMVKNTVTENEVPKIENKLSKTDEKTELLDDLDKSDLRFLLLARRRKSMDASMYAEIERKKPKTSDIDPKTPKKKVTFDVNSKTDDSVSMSECNTPEHCNSLTKTNAIQTPKTSFLHLKDLPSYMKNNTYIETPMTNLPKMHVKGLGIPNLPTIEMIQNIGVARKEIWYIVADTDVILLDYEFIDNLVLSEPKCKLLIPHAVRTDIEGLCIGDCRGQQRVINARQLTRRLATPPPHYIVEPTLDDIDNIKVTTENILNCCLQAVNDNHYVVLITNDPYLQTKAHLLNIPSYRLNEIKNGVNIKPDVTSQPLKFDFNSSNDDIEENPFLQSNSNFSIFSNILSPIETIKKQLFYSEDEEMGTNVLDCDKLINITKPKSFKNMKHDSDTLEISREVKHLNLKEKNILKPQNENNPFLSEKNNLKSGFINFKKKIQNPNFIFNSLLSEINPKSKRELFNLGKPVSKPNYEIPNFQIEIPKNNSSTTEKLFCSIPLSNVKQFQIQKSVESSGVPANTKMSNMCISLRHDPNGISKESRIINSTQSRIKKIFSSINNNSSTKTENQEDSTKIFKVPQTPVFKNRTRNPGHIEISNSTDKIRMQDLKNIDGIEESLKRFGVKSKIMSEKISTRMDEWICTFTQIIEDVLSYLLQENSESMKDTLAPLTLHDTLNCIKLLYDSHTKVRDAIDKVSELMDKCNCLKGKLNSSIKPDDFMKMFGYGVLLVLNLQKILPPSEELKEAESSLSSLLSTIESKSKDLDPDLLRTPSVNRTDLEGKDEIRPNFVKEPSYVLDYLKKHYKAWASYKEDPQALHHNNVFVNNPDFKVLRTFGKNLNLLKIDNSKTISLSKQDPTKKTRDRPKVIRLLENNELSTQENSKNVEIIKKKDGPQLIKLFNNEEDIYLSTNKNITDLFSKENEMEIDQEKEEPNIIKPIEIIDQKAKNETKITEELNFITHENTFTQNEETAGPKVIRNIKVIDEYENKVRNREPLDLDLLDYSEIYEPSVAENLEFDVLSVKINNSQEEDTKKLEKNNDNYGLSNTVCTLEDFTQDVTFEDKADFYASPTYILNNYNNMFDNQHSHTQNLNNNSKNNNNKGYYFYAESDSYSDLKNNLIEKAQKPNSGTKNNTSNDNLASRNDSCIDNDNSVTCNDNSESQNINPNSHNDNVKSHNDNSGKNNDNFDKTAQILQDDITNDSGFENDSTYAHSMVKIFLNELSTSFKVIYKFVSTFVAEIREKEMCEMRMHILHNQASKSLEDMVAIVQQLRSIIRRESAEETLLKTLLLKAGVEAATDKRMTRYRQVVMKSLEQALILENALKIIVSTTIGDFDAVSTNAESLNSSIRYFNIFE